MKKAGWTRMGRYGTLALTAAVLAVYLLEFISPDLADLSGDSARYLLLGRALAAGSGYVELWTPGAPPHTEFAPGLPLLIAPLLHFFPASLTPVKIMIYAFLAGAVAAFYWLNRLQHRPDRRHAAGLALVLASTPYLSRFANQALSDLPYTAVSLLGLGLAYRALNQAKPRPQAWFFIGLVFSLAFLFRQTAAALVPAALLAVLFHRPYSRSQKTRAAALLILGFSIPVSFWLLRNYLAAGALDPSHWDKLFAAEAADPLAGTVGWGGLLARTARGLAAYAGMVPWAVFDLAWPERPRAVNLALTLAVLVPLAVGGGAHLLTRRGPLAWYLAIYLLMISVWQSHYLRYLVPVIPVVLILMADGLEIILSKALRRNGGPLASILLAGAVGMNLLVFAGDAVWIGLAPVTPAVDARTGEPLDKDGRRLVELAGEVHWGYWHQYPDLRKSRDPAALALRYHRMLAAAAWMGEGLPSDAVVMTRKPTLVSYYSGRRCVQFFAETDPAVFWARCRKAGVRYFLMDEVSPGVRSVFGSHLRELPTGRLGFRSEVSVVFALGDTQVIDTPGIRE